MRREIGSYVVDIDVAATEQAYKNMLLLTQQCSCDSCRNYNEAISSIPEVRTFMESLGIDVYKASEMWIPFELENGLINYWGFYHVCGKIISGARPDNFSEDHPAGYFFDETNTIKVGENFKVGFKNECDLLEDWFTPPCFQMDIFADIPWVIEKGDESAYYPYEREKSGLIPRIKSLFRKHYS